MKKRILLIASVISLGTTVYGQQVPTSSNPGGLILSGQTNNQFWSRAGNNNITGSNNILGTLWNSPIYTVTNSVNRSKLNGNLNYTVGGYNSAKNGYMLIGIDN